MRMIPITDYLYYKLYQFSLKSSLRDIPEFLTPVFLGGLICANIIVISGFLSNVTDLPFLFSNGIQGGLFSIVIIILIMFYYQKKRYKLILIKYSQESENQRIRGNIIVAVYVALSFLLIFVVAFTKP